MPPRRARPLVTLTSDFGSVYAAQMRGALLRTLSPGRLVDLAHDLPAHGIAEAAFLLRQMARSYPAGTVHLAVIDPGVGGPRAPIAIRVRGGGYLVGPDNGLLWPLAEALGYERAVALDRRRVGGPAETSPTFDGRDLFAPAAAALAEGRPLSALGPAHEPLRYEVPTARQGSDGWVGTVLHVDRFGGLVTDLPPEAMPAPPAPLVLRPPRGRPRRLLPVRVYAELPPGEIGLLRSSFGTLEISGRERSAARTLRMRTGDAFRLYRERPTETGSRRGPGVGARARPPRRAALERQISRRAVSP